MERQNRLITGLLLAFLVLVLVAYFGKEPAKKADDDSPPERKVLEWKSDDVTSLELAGPGRTVTFAKTDGVWKMTAPKEAPAEERKVTEIVDRITGLEVEEREITGNLADFGLDPEHRTAVTLKKADGTSATVYVGKDTPVGYRTYVAEKPDGPVLLAATRIGEMAQRGPDDFRAREPWRVSSATARRVRVEDAGRSVVLRKDDHGWWLGDEGPRVDEAKVQDWLAKASALRAETFHDGVDPASLGLASATTTIQVEDDTGTHALRYGNRDAGGVDVLGDQGPAMRLGPEALELLILDGWTSSELLTVRRWQVDTIEVQLGDVTARLAKKDGKWTDAAGKEVEVDALLDAVESGTADRARADVPAPATPWGKVVLAEGATRREEVTIGEPVDGGRVAKDAAGGPPFVVPQATIDAIVAAVPK
ncbi:MAG: DUF4340 domain-containing protein [Myxococcota bacterium]